MPLDLAARTERAQSEPISPAEARASPPPAVRWIPVAAAIAAVRVLPEAGLVIAAAACALFTLFLLRRSTSKPLPLALGGVEALIVLPMLWGRGASAFAAVWLVGQAVGFGRPVSTHEFRAFERRTPLVVATALGLVAILAFNDIAGRIVFGPRYAEVAWLLVVYIIALVLRAWCAALTNSRDDAIYLFAGFGVLQAAATLGLGRSPAAAVAGAFVAGAIGLGAVSWRARGDAPKTSRSPSVPDLWGLPPANVVAGLTTIALAVRLAMDRGLWLDEAIGVSQAKLPFASMIAELRVADIHPPLHAVLMWLTTRAFGTSSFAVRSLSIVAGTLLIPLLYAAGRDIYDRRAGVMAAALGTFAPLLVWYSQEARMYSVLLLFSVASLWFQVRAVRRGRTSDWMLFGACCALMLWTHYFSVLQVVTQHIAIAVMAVQMRRRGEPARELVQGWTRSVIVLLVLFAPLAPFVRDQLGVSGQLAGLDVPSRNPGLEELSIYAIFANSVWALWGYHSAEAMRQIVALWPLAMLFVLFLLGRGRARVMWLLAAVTLVPVVVLFIAGLRLRDLFEIRYFITAVPAMILIVAHLATRIDVSRATTGIAAAAILSTLGIALADQQINHRNPRRYDFEGALSYVTERAGPDDAILYAPRYLDSLVDYYAPDVDSRALVRGPPDAPPEQVFVVASWDLLDRREPKDALSEVIDRTARGRRLIDEVDRQGVFVQVWR